MRSSRGPVCRRTGGQRDTGLPVLSRGLRPLASHTKLKPPSFGQNCGAGIGTVPECWLRSVPRFAPRPQRSGLDLRFPFRTRPTAVQPGRKGNTGHLSRKLLAQASMCLLEPRRVACDVEEGDSFHGAALLRPVRPWAGDEGVLQARLLGAALSTEAGPLGGEAGRSPPPRAALLALVRRSGPDPGGL